MSRELSNGLNQNELKRLFFYDNDSGNLYWKTRPLVDFKNERVCKIWNSKCEGKIAGSITHGYRQVSINKKFYLVHRLVWIYMNGDINSDFEIDHIDCNRSNNKIDNLRLSTHSENLQNYGLRSDRLDAIVEFCKGGKTIAELCIEFKIGESLMHKDAFYLFKSGRMKIIKVKAVRRGQVPRVFITTGFELDADHQYYVDHGVSTMVETVVPYDHSKNRIKSKSIAAQQTVTRPTRFEYPDGISLDFIKQAHNPFQLGAM